MSPLIFSTVGAPVTRSGIVFTYLNLQDERGAETGIIFKTSETCCIKNEIYRSRWKERDKERLNAREKEKETEREGRGMREKEREKREADMQTIRERQR